MGLRLHGGRTVEVLGAPHGPLELLKRLCQWCEARDVSEEQSRLHVEATRLMPRAQADRGAHAVPRLSAMASSCACVQLINVQCASISSTFGRSGYPLRPGKTRSTRSGMYLAD